VTTIRISFGKLANAFIAQKKLETDVQRTSHFLEVNAECGMMEVEKTGIKKKEMYFINVTL